MKILSIINHIKSVNELQVGNILHYGTFYKSTIHLNHIKSTQIGLEEFNPGVYHVALKFIVFENAPAIELFDQLHPTKPAIKVRSLILSTEGVKPKSHKYSLIESYLGHYLMNYRLVTGDEFDRWTKQYKHPLTFYTLQISPESSGRILLSGIKTSEKLGLQNIYHLFTNNCSTAALSLIDQELNISTDKSTWDKFEDALSIAGPIGTLHALKLRKLL